MRRDGDTCQCAQGCNQRCNTRTHLRCSGAKSAVVVVADLRYLDLVDKAEAETDTKKLEEIAERQKAYLHYRAEKDPARGMFTRMYGPEWTETYIHQFLFDLEDKMDKGVYKVRPELASD